MNLERYSPVLEFDNKNKPIKLNIFFDVLGNSIHLRKVFFVILVFKMATGIFSSLQYKSKLGQISESTKNNFSGCHFKINFFIKKFTSKKKSERHY